MQRHQSHAGIRQFFHKQLRAIPAMGLGFADAVTLLIGQLHAYHVPTQRRRGLYCRIALRSSTRWSACEHDLVGYNSAISAQDCSAGLCVLVGCDVASSMILSWIPEEKSGCWKWACWLFAARTDLLLVNKLASIP